MQLLRLAAQRRSAALLLAALVVLSLPLLVLRPAAARSSPQLFAPSHQVPPAQW